LERRLCSGSGLLKGPEGDVLRHVLHPGVHTVAPLSSLLDGIPVCLHGQPWGGSGDYPRLVAPGVCNVIFCARIFSIGQESHFLCKARGPIFFLYPTISLHFHSFWLAGPEADGSNAL
jgi:hypothetical protein